MMTDSPSDDAMDPYFSGKQLYGNDFTQAEIDRWFADENDGYFALTKERPETYSYGYHALNIRHGFSLLPNQRFDHVLAVGAAYGNELAPIMKNCEKITILEPADGFKSTTVDGIPVTYEKPLSSGVIPFQSASFDLLLCLGVLHHIPNVGMVLNECYRVLKPGGFALLREPTISMGDWRKPRRGLTKHERGIPLNIFRELISDSNFRIIHERRCMFSLTPHLRHLFSGSVYNNAMIVALDEFMCALPIFSNVYHPRSSFQKLRATSAFFVLDKQEA